MENATNVFSKGLMTDMHPLTTPETIMTDALNASTLTYNGNELMLQNDMGNTRIQDGVTGSIMGLHPGFIPLGMKERGGVLYFASVKKDDNGNLIGELGSIPSPYITYSGFTDPYESIESDHIDEKEEFNITEHLTSDVESGEETLEEEKLLNPGDPFIVCLDIDEDKLKYISGFNDQNQYERRYYEIKLYAITSDQGEIDLTDLLDLHNPSKRAYLDVSDLNPIRSKYWFATEDIEDQLETLKTTERCLFYPNISKGKLKIKIVQESIDSFDLGPCSIVTNNGVNYPVVYYHPYSNAQKESNPELSDIAIVQIQSFQFKSTCSFKVTKIKLRAYSTTTQDGSGDRTYFDIRYANADSTGFTFDNGIDNSNNKGLYTLDTNNYATATKLNGPRTYSNIIYYDSSTGKDDAPIYMEQSKDSKIIDRQRKALFTRFLVGQRGNNFDKNKIQYITPFYENGDLDEIQHYNDPKRHDGIFTIDLNGKLNQWVHFDIEAYDTTFSTSVSSGDNDVLLWTLTRTLNPAHTTSDYNNFRLLPDSNCNGDLDYVNQFSDKTLDPDAEFDLKLNGLVRGNGKYYMTYNENTKLYEESKEPTYALNSSGEEAPRIECHPQYYENKPFVINGKSSKGIYHHPNRRLISIAKKLDGESKYGDSAYYYSNFTNLIRRPNIAEETGEQSGSVKLKRHLTYAPYTLDLEQEDVQNLGFLLGSSAYQKLNKPQEFLDKQAKYWEGYDKYKDVKIPIDASGNYYVTHTNDVLEGINKGILRTDINPLQNSLDSTNTEKYITDSFYRNWDKLNNPEFDDIYSKNPPFAKTDDWNDIDTKSGDEDILYFHNGEMQAMNGVVGYPSVSKLLDFDYSGLANVGDQSYFAWMSEPYNSGSSGLDFHIELASRFNNRNLIGQVSEAIAGSLVDDKPKFELPFILQLQTHYNPIAYKYALNYLLANTTNEKYVLNIVNRALEKEKTKLLSIYNKNRTDTSRYKAFIYANQYWNEVQLQLGSSSDLKNVKLSNSSNEGIDMYQLASSENYEVRNLTAKTNPNYACDPSFSKDFDIELSRAILSLKLLHVGEVHIEYDDTTEKIWTWIGVGIAIIAIVAASVCAAVFTGGASIGAGTASIAALSNSLVISAYSAVFSSVVGTSITMAASVAATATAIACSAIAAASITAAIGALVGAACAISSLVESYAEGNIYPHTLDTYAIKLGVVDANSIMNESDMINIILSQLAFANEYYSYMFSDTTNEKVLPLFQRINCLSKEGDPTVATAFFGDNNAYYTKKYFFGFGLNALLEIDKNNSKIWYNNRSSYVLHPLIDLVNGSGDPAGYRDNQTLRSEIDIDLENLLSSNSEEKDFFTNTLLYDSSMHKVDICPDATFKEYGYMNIGDALNKSVNISIPKGHYVLNANYASGVKNYIDDTSDTSVNNSTTSNITTSVSDVISTNSNIIINKTDPSISNNLITLKINMDIDANSLRDFTQPCLITTEGTKIYIGKNAKHLYFPENTVISNIVIPKYNNVYFSVGLYKILDSSDCLTRLENTGRYTTSFVDKYTDEIDDIISIPAVYCYNENNGCMDTMYQGKWYPLLGYQHVIGYYTLNSDLVSPDYNGEELTIDGEYIKIRNVLA